MKILVIPDTQIRKGVPVGHIMAASRYAVKHLPDVIVVLGDWWDMPSLSLFNSALDADGARIVDDIQAGKDAMEEFMIPIYHEIIRREHNHRKRWKPRLVFCTGNHDPMVRVPRYIESHPVLEGFLQDDTKQFLETMGFEVYGFLEVVNIEGIRFSHYFQNPHSLKKTPISGMIDTCLKNVGFSFVQGHQQTYRIGKHYLGDGSIRLGIICGAFYDHDETYAGLQGNRHWRGIIMLNEVKDGGADVAEVSLAYLKEKYKN
jgi:predicted phosphodiesterase